jgi:AraC-like DNA-binding protein
MAKGQGDQADGSDSDRSATLFQKDAGRPGLQALRERTSETLCDLTSTKPDAEFETTCSVTHLGAAVLFDTHMTPARLERTPLHLARGGIDHYQVRMFLEGGCYSECGGRLLEVDPGSICVCDMGERERFDVFASCVQRSAHLLTMFLPRTLVSPLLKAPDSVGSMLISGKTPYGRLLGDYLVSVWRALNRLSPQEMDAIVRAAATLIAGGVGVSTDGRRSFSNAQHKAKVAAMKSYIREHAGSPGLTVEFLTRAFAISRTSLFRLFEADGGPIRYVQKCRLDRAFATLTSTANRHRSIFDIALDCCFATEGSFIRAFRRTFGITPGELRKKIDSLGIRGFAEDEVAQLDRPVGLIWLEGLSSPGSSMGDDM